LREEWPGDAVRINAKLEFIKLKKISKLQNIAFLHRPVLPLPYN